MKNRNVETVWDKDLNCRVPNDTQGGGREQKILLPRKTPNCKVKKVWSLLKLHILTVEFLLSENSRTIQIVKGSFIRNRRGKYQSFPQFGFGERKLIAAKIFKKRKRTVCFPYRGYIGTLYGISGFCTAARFAKFSSFGNFVQFDLIGRQSKTIRVFTHFGIYLCEHPRTGICEVGFIALFRERISARLSAEVSR